MKSAALWIALCAGLLPGFVAPASALTPREREIVTGMRGAIVALRGKLAEAETANRKSLAGLRKATTQVQELQKEATQAAMDAAALAAERDSLAAKLASEGRRYDLLNRKYQRAEMIIALAVAGLAAILALQLGGGLPPQYRLAVAFGGALAAAAAVYILL